MKDTETVRVVGAAIVQAGRCLVTQRGASMTMPGKWEFPGGKVEFRERPEKALARELREELGIEAEVGAWLGRGDAIHAGRRVCLDVYLATADTRTLKLHEHSAFEWLGAPALDAPDWADADIPVLPALRACLTANTLDHRSPRGVSILAADWGKQPAKRAVYGAENRAGRFKLVRHEHAEGFTVRALLELANAMRARSGDAVLVGIDVSLGIPAAIARRSGASNFVDFLSRLGSGGGLERECGSAPTWSPDAPFFRIPPGRGAKHAFYAAAGGQTSLLRQIEARTGGNPTFALSGIPGTVGSGSREVWRELAPWLRNRSSGPDFRLWPFEGSIRCLVGDRHVVLGEIYPRAAYALALADTLPTPTLRIAKTKRAAREAALARLEHATWIAMAGVELPDLSAAMASEDDFDALLTAAALTRAQVEGLPLSCDLVDPLAEGGMLATGRVELPPMRWRRS